VGLRWDLHCFDAFGGEHWVERCAVFGVSVADEESELGDPVAEVVEEVAGSLCGEK
jgi:hypothetical protein